MKKTIPIVVRTISIIIILIIGFFLIGVFVIQDKYEPEKKISTEFKNGLWISSMDSLSNIDIKNGKWIFIHNGQYDSTDVYKMELKSELPNYADPLLNQNDFLILSNKTDTLYYEIMGYDKSLFSLMHFPSGKIHVYSLK